MDLKQTTEGAYEGKAELSLEGVKLCVLLIAQLPSLEAALERVKHRTEEFVTEWMSRPHTGDTEVGDLAA